MVVSERLGGVKSGDFRQRVAWWPVDDDLRQDTGRRARSPTPILLAKGETDLGRVGRPL